MTFERLVSPNPSVLKRKGSLFCLNKRSVSRRYYINFPALRQEVFIFSKQVFDLKVDDNNKKVAHENGTTGNSVIYKFVWWVNPRY